MVEGCGTVFYPNHGLRLHLFIYIPTERPFIMTLHCLNCERDETIIPLVSLRYAGEQAWICSQCLPILIHDPQRLVGRLAGAEHIEPAEHED